MDRGTLYPFCLLGLTLAMSGLASCRPVTIPEGPCLVLAPDVVDLGEAYSSEEVSGRIVVANGGRARLDILAVKTSCTCTLVSMPKDSLDPGEEAEVVVATSSTKPGKGVASVAFETNDPHTPTMVASLEYSVSSALRLAPARVFLSKQDIATGKKRNVRLHNALPELYSIVRIEDEDCPEVSVAREETEFSVSCAPRGGPVNGTLRVEVAAPGSKSHVFVLPVRVE